MFCKTTTKPQSKDSKRIWIVYTMQEQQNDETGKNIKKVGKSAGVCKVACCHSTLKDYLKDLTQKINLTAA